ncbi:MAG: tetratricopeptide repeat protein, partial [Bacteroidales bacterium]|nr:tetratricopeptide repeat protein [Bacteroidales bacterium]
IEFYKKAIKYDKNYDRAYYYLAHAYDKIGDKENALKNFYKCVEIDPMDFITYNDIGSIYEERGNLTEAKKHLEEGHFTEGSMAPKVKAAIFFMENGGKECIISDFTQMGIENAGTRIVK